MNNINKQQFQAGFKSKNVCPPIETLTEELWYAFTYNPSEQPQLLNGEVHFDDWIIGQRRSFNQYDQSSCSLIMFMESSSIGRLHWHGYIKFHDLKKFIIFTYPLIIARASTEIDYLNDKPVWQDYSTKQLNIFGETYQTARDLPEREVYECNEKQRSGESALQSEYSFTNPNTTVAKAKGGCLCFRKLKGKTIHNKNCIFS
jgi:hypothetical protein